MRHDFAERSSMSDACCVDRLIDIFLANRFVGLPNRARQEATIDANIDPNPSRKRLRGTPNRPEIDPRTLSGRPVAHKIVRSASRERLGASPAGLRAAQAIPKAAPGHQKERPGAPRSAPRRPKLMPSRVRDRRNRFIFGAARAGSVVRTIYRRFCSISNLIAKFANPPKYRACRSKSRFGPSRCESSRSCYAASKIDENRLENWSQVGQNRDSGPLGRLFRSAFVARSGQNRAERREEADRSSQGVQASPIEPA